MLFSNQIAHFRKKRGLTQADIREKLYNITGKKFRQGTISFWENGKTVPSISILNALAQILGVSSDQLYEEEVSVKREENNAIDYLEYKNIAEASDDLFDTDQEKAYELLREAYDDMYTQLGRVDGEREKMHKTLRSLKELMNL